jgi:hypothetical protein
VSAGTITWAIKDDGFGARTRSNTADVSNIVRRRRLGLLEVSDVTFHIKSRLPLRVEGIFGDQAARVTALVRQQRVGVQKHI